MANPPPTSPEPAPEFEHVKDAGPSPPHRIGQAVHRSLDSLLVTPLAPGLHIVATPIGNLADITIRALSVLARADVVYCEDTRHSLRLLQHYAIERRMVPYHEHNA